MGRKPLTVKRVKVTLVLDESQRDALAREAKKRQKGLRPDASALVRDAIRLWLEHPELRGE
jgi:Arc/MetJ-type ribon-helix-helix transcriptional regulator